MTNWNWSNDDAQLGDLLETNVCVHCVWDLELLAGVGWLHRKDPRGLEITCLRPEPAKSICLTCGNYCYAYPNGELYRHSGPFLGSLCRGSGKPGTPPTPEEKAFAPNG